jgi:hypothetical protein
MVLILDTACLSRISCPRKLIVKKASPKGLAFTIELTRFNKTN